MEKLNKFWEKYEIYVKIFKKYSTMSLTKKGLIY